MTEGDLQGSDNIPSVIDRHQMLKGTGPEKLMEFTSFKCDECGKVKGETNHWYRAAMIVGQWVIARWPLSFPNGFEEGPTISGARDVKHLCGMSCAVKAMTKAMEAE